MLRYLFGTVLLQPQVLVPINSWRTRSTRQNNIMFCLYLLMTAKCFLTHPFPGGPASSVDKHKVCLIAKQESSGSLDSTGAVSCTSSTNQTPATASEGGDGDACSIASLDVKEEPEQLDQQLNGCTSDQNTEDNEEEEEEEEGEEEEDDEEEEDGEEEEEDDEEDFEGVEEECPDNKLSSEEQASRASSEEVDLSNVVPAVETEQLGQQEHQPEAGPQPFQQEQQFEQQPQLDLPAQEELNIGKCPKMFLLDGVQPVIVNLVL